jgi:hypothetical protein
VKFEIIIIITGILHFSNLDIFVAMESSHIFSKLEIYLHGPRVVTARRTSSRKFATTMVLVITIHLVADQQKESHASGNC